MRGQLAAAVVVAGVVSGALGAQQIPSRQFEGLAPGMRIRVSADRFFAEKISGTIVYASADSIVLDTLDMRAVDRRFFPKTQLVDAERHVTLPVYDVDSVDVSLGTSRLKGMLKAGRTAAIIGGALVGLTYVSGVNNMNFKNFRNGFRSGATIGAVVGISIGFSYGSERWRTVGKLRPSWLRRGPDSGEQRQQQDQ